MDERVVMPKQTSSRKAAVLEKISEKAIAQGSAKLFGLMWAFIHIYENTIEGRVLTPAMKPDALLGALIVSLAIWLAFSPDSEKRLLILAAVAACSTALKLPLITNHGLIMLLLNLALLAQWSFMRLRRQDYESLYQHTVPLLRLMFAMAYGAAAIAKINSDFLNPATSCANSLFAKSLSVLPSSMAQTIADLSAPFMPWYIMIAELSIPILLLVPKTRNFAVVGASVFHFGITASPPVSGAGFTFMLVCLLSIFLSDPVRAEIHARLERHFRRVPRPWGITIVVIACALFILLPLDRTSNPFRTIRRIPVNLTVLLLIFEYCRAIWIRRIAGKTRSPLLSTRNVVGALFVGLVLLNAASPYLGGKTLVSFTMYSNLQTERDRHNHLLIPRIGLWSGQDDVVRIVESPIPRFQSWAGVGAWIPIHEVRRRVRPFQDFPLSYTDGNVVYSAERARDIEHLGLANRNLIGEWLLAYRPQIDGEQPCLW
jgi:hypothetical protein